MLANRLIDGSTEARVAPAAAGRCRRTNLYSRVYNFKAGYGLIDAQAAINRLIAQ